MAWTEERVELLKKLWAEGLSASQIANRFGDITRNAVIGKVHRLGLAGRATTQRIKATRTRKQSSKPRRARSPRFPRLPGAREALRKLGSEPLPERSFEIEGELEIPLEERASIETLTPHSCRWPIGDPTHEDFHFCGRTKMPGLPYCEFHAHKAYQPLQSSAGRKTEPAVRQAIAG